MVNVLTLTLQREITCLKAELDVTPSPFYSAEETQETPALVYVQASFPASFNPDVRQAAIEDVQDALTTFVDVVPRSGVDEFLGFCEWDGRPQLAVKLGVDGRVTPYQLAALRGQLSIVAQRYELDAIELTVAEPEYIIAPATRYN